MSNAGEEHRLAAVCSAQDKALMRAYSIASPHYEETLEFLSVKVPDGQLTSQLQHIQPGEQVLVSSKPVSTLVLRDLNPGRRLYLFATGTGLAPFLSIVRDPEAYERFENIVLIHGVRRKTDLAYADYIANVLPTHELLGDEIRQKLIYYPTVTREPFRNQGPPTISPRAGSSQISDFLRLLPHMTEP
jgi:ferredoxin--NADP+ reductase